MQSEESDLKSPVSQVEISFAETLSNLSTPLSVLKFTVEDLQEEFSSRKTENLRLGAALDRLEKACDQVIGIVRNAQGLCRLPCTPVQLEQNSELDR